MAGALLGLLLIGCLKETHRLDADVQVVAPVGAWGVPLANLSLTTDDLPLTFTESVASNGLGSAFVWTSEFPREVMRVEDWVTWPDLEAAALRTLTEEEVQALGFLPAGEPMALAVQESVPVEGLDGHEIARLEFSGGTLRCTAVATSGIWSEAAMTLPQLFQNGEPVVLSTSSLVNGTELDLTGAVLLMAPGETELAIAGEVHVSRTGEPIASEAELGWTFTWDALEMELFEGRLGALGPMAFTAAHEVALPEWLQGSIGLSAPALKLVVEQGQGIGCSLELAGQILQSSSSLPFQWAPLTPPVVPAAPVPGTTTSAAFLLNDATTTPPLGTWVSSEFRGLSYEAAFSVVDPGEELQFLSADAEIAVQPSIEVPFIGYASRIAWRDTVPCDLEAALAGYLPATGSLDQINRLTFRFQTANHLPLGIAVQAHFLDANGEFLDALFLDSTTFLEPATMAQQGGHDVPVGPGLRTWDLVFEGAAVAELMASGVHSLAFELTGCTAGSLEQRPVAFGPGLGLNLSVGMRADLNLSTP